MLIKTISPIVQPVLHSGGKLTFSLPSKQSFRHSSTFIPLFCYPQQLNQGKLILCEYLKHLQRAKLSSPSQGINISA